MSPQRQRELCRMPACPNLVTPKRGEPFLCEDHQRPTAAKRGYGSKWQRSRAAFLKKNQRCVRCGAPATVADHIIPRTSLVGIVPDPDARHRLAALCRGCHNRKTAEEYR